MSTKIIVDARRSGKTTKAIHESAKTGRYIVAANKQMAKFIYEMALEMEKYIPFPLTVYDFLDQKIPTSIKQKGIIIDEGLIILETILDTKIHMITMSERPKEEVKEKKYRVRSGEIYFLEDLFKYTFVKEKAHLFDSKRRAESFAAETGGIVEEVE